MAIPFRVLGARSTAIDTVEVRFNHDVNPSLTSDNFAIAQAYGLGPLAISSISMKYDNPTIAVIKTYTQIPFMFYKITTSGVRSLSTNEPIDSNYVDNTVVFDGFSEPNNILDSMINSLSPIISAKTKIHPNSVEVETNTSKFFRAVADDVLKIYKEVGNTAMDNYLSLTVSSEQVIRGKGNYDRLGKYGAFEISRVAKEPSVSATVYSESTNVYFDGDVQLITQSIIGSLVDTPALLNPDDPYAVPYCEATPQTPTTIDTIILPYDARELVNAGRFLRSGTEDKCITVVGAEEALITSTPYVVQLAMGPVLKVVFVYNATLNFAYPLTSYGLLDNFYDANNAHVDTRLTGNQFRLNPAVGGFAPPSAGDRLLVVYTHNNSTRSVLDGSVVVTADAARPAQRRVDFVLPSSYYTEGIVIPEEDIATSLEPPFGPTNLEEVRLRGLEYKIANGNLLNTTALKPATVSDTSLAIFLSEKTTDEYGRDFTTMRRVDKYGGDVVSDPTDPESGVAYNVNPFMTEVAWDASMAGKLKWGQYMVDYTASVSTTAETRIEYGVPTIDDFYVPPWLAQTRLLSIPPVIYVSYLYKALYSEGIDYSIILDTKNMFTTDKLLVGAIVPINSTSSRLYSGQLVNAYYQYETVFVQGKDYNLFANVEECYERVENRVSIDSDGNVSVGTLHYPIEEVNSVFSEGTAGVQFPVLRTRDNLVDIGGSINTANVYETVTFKTLQESVDIVARGNSITLSSPMILNSSHSILGGDVYDTVTGAKVNKMGIRTLYLAGSDAAMQAFMITLLEAGEDISRFAGISLDSALNPFIISPTTVSDLYYDVYNQDIDPARLALFNVLNCVDTTDASLSQANQITNISQIPSCFTGVIDSSVKFEDTICVYDGGGYCMLTRGKEINVVNSTRPENDEFDIYGKLSVASSQIDVEHLQAAQETNVGDGFSTLGKTSPNFYDTPEFCTDYTNADPNLYNLRAPCKSSSCCGYTSIFGKEVPFVDGKTEFYRRHVDQNNRPYLDITSSPVLSRREPYGTYSIDYVSGVVHTSLDPASVAANTQKQVTVDYAVAAVDTKNPYIIGVDGVEKQSVTKASGANVQVEALELLRIDRYGIGTIYFSDICDFDNGTKCTNYPYAIPVLDQFQGQYTPTGCIYDQNTTGYSVCAKMDGAIVAVGSSPDTADPDYIYRLSTTSKMHGVCMETSCRDYTPSGKSKDYAGTNGRGLFYHNCRNSMCPNYRPIYLGQDEQLVANYSYVVDSLVIDYVYGDNGIDWSTNLNALQPSGTRFIGVQDDGERYYVTYKIGAREPALYNNFAYALGTPSLDASSRRWAKEMYRKAIVGVISAYLAGPTFYGIDSLVETFTDTPPEIVEGSTYGWILGENYIYVKPESLTGPVLYTHATATMSSSDEFGLGLWMRGPDVLKYDGQANFRISNGSIDMFVAPEWKLNNRKIIVDLYQNNSQSLRGAGVIDDDTVSFVNGVRYDATTGVNIIESEAEIDFRVNAGSVVSWKTFIIDTKILPSYVDEANKITITATVTPWNDSGEDVYSPQVDEYGEPYCGIYGTAYPYGGGVSQEFTAEFITVVGQNGYTCPVKTTSPCAIMCSGQECMDLQCDCVEHCHETVFVDLDVDIAASANTYIGRYLTILTGYDAGESYVIGDTTAQTIQQDQVKDVHTTYAHTNPQVGDAYIIPADVPQFTLEGFDNIWYGNENKIAIWNGKTWDFVTPSTGMMVWVIDAQYQFKWDGGSWGPATTLDTDIPGERGSSQRVGFVLTGYISTEREAGIAYRIHETPRVLFSLAGVPTSRYLDVALKFVLDKDPCDPSSYGYSYGEYPSQYEAMFTCGTSLGVENIEVFYTNPVCAFEAPVISTLFDIRDESSNDLFSNRMSIFRDESGLLRFRVYEDKSQASKYLETLSDDSIATSWPAFGDCRSYYEVVVDLNKIYNDTTPMPKGKCGPAKNFVSAGSAEWSTRRRHYLGFSWALNDGSVACTDKRSNLHVFVDGNEYPKVDDTDTIGWVNHGILCPDGTLYEYRLSNQQNGLSELIQADKFIQRKDFDSLALCDKPKYGVAAMDVYLEGWREDTTIQWESFGKTDDVKLPVNIDISGNMIRLQSDDKSVLWPCEYYTSNNIPSIDPDEPRVPAGMYISSLFDSLVNMVPTVVDGIHWVGMSMTVTSSNLQRKMFSLAKNTCEGEVIDYCHFDDCAYGSSSEYFPPIDVGVSRTSVNSAVKVFYRTSEYANFMENGVPSQWVMLDYTVSIQGDTIPPVDAIPECTDKIICSATIDAIGRYIQYRVELYSDGTFTPAIFSVDLSCDKTRINNYALPVMDNGRLLIKPLANVGASINP